jgi:quinol monooxygenase YgiN
MAKATVIMRAELKTGVDRQEFENFQTNELAPQWEKAPGLLKASLLRCEKGEKKGSYLVINTYESMEKYDQAWPSWGEAGPSIQKWIATHQALWDKAFSFVDLYPLSDDIPVYVEID